jgi:putative SOS response-associated peptidase YedK
LSASDHHAAGVTVHGPDPQREEAPTLRREDHDVWLMGGPDKAFAALQQYPDEPLMAYRVTTRVNSSKINDAELLKSMAA